MLELPGPQGEGRGPVDSGRLSQGMPEGLGVPQLGGGTKGQA